MKYLTPEEIRAGIQEFVSKIGADPIARRVTWGWGPTSMVRTLAYAMWPECSVTLSPTLWPLLSAGERRETLAHEVAHLGDFLFLFNTSSDAKRVHGSSWKAMMARAGYPNAQACTELNPRVQRAALAHSKNHIPVSCPCRVHYITRHQAMNLAMDKARMKCRHCQAYIEVHSFIDGDTIVFGKGSSK